MMKNFVRTIVIVFTCAFIFLTNAVPAFAIESYQSDVREGETQLLETQKLTDEVSRYAPGNPNTEQTQERTNNGGLNEVQGTADIDQMKRPENSTEAVSVEDEINNLLGKVTGKK
ncbi:MAG: hypothetical protein KME29_22720 [Calothrix sp. FI2-JRJ7]|jgi:hypothetical protein|nr:hypothetical protein [Calothrix sp. FI2-JRJ7]